VSYFRTYRKGAAQRGLSRQDTATLIPIDITGLEPTKAALDGLKLVPPFQLTWFEHFGQGENHWAIMAMRMTMARGYHMLRTHNQRNWNTQFSENIERWVAARPTTCNKDYLVQLFLVKTEEDAAYFMDPRRMLLSAFLPLDPDGHLLDEINLNFNDLFATVDLQRLRVVMTALGICNAQNADMIEKTNPSANQHRTEKPFKITWRQLVIRQKERVTYIGSQSHGETQGLTALHICRGHFKTYTAERPLLGHAIGTFYWPEHVRGNPEHGIVTGSYEVNSSSPMHSGTPDATSTIE